MPEPFLCIITPIFDPALECFKKLVDVLKNQTCGDFIHIAISNGEAPLIREFIKTQDNRFIYDEIPFNVFIDPKDLVANLGLRREHCLKKYDAQRYLFLDADLRVFRNDYFEYLKEFHNKSEILLTQVKYRTLVYPIPPICLGNIDIANFSFSNKIAKKYKYPTDFDPWWGYANDYRFFSSIESNSTYYINIAFSEKDGNNNGSYKRVSEQKY